MGVEVIDNDGSEHVISVGFDGEIQGHSQEDYPDDPAKRSNFEDEMVSQARRYAEWYVYREHGHDTLSPDWNPDRIAASLLALLDLEPAEFERQFGTLHRQLRSYYDDDASRPVELEDSVPHEEGVIYRQNLYLDADTDELRGTHREFADRVNQSALDTLADALNRGMTGLFDDDTDVIDEISDLVHQPDLDVGSFTFEDVSDLYYGYYPGDGGFRKVGEESGPDRDPDTVVQLLTVEPGPLVELHAYLLYHLQCQIRDCFVGMGVDPPLAYRILGPGIHKCTLKYRDFDMYPMYIDPDADIEGYTGP